MDLCRRLVFAYSFLSHCGVLSALFTVQALQSYYTAQYGDNVSLECRFQVLSGRKTKNLKIYWEHTSQEGISREIVSYSEEKGAPESSDYRGRMKLLEDELDDGRAILYISNVKLTDTGRYLCLISNTGADYKYISLEVQAPYKQINTSVADVLLDTGEMVKEISCQSEGYPLAEVFWLNGGQNLSSMAKTTFTQTVENIFIVTSVIRIASVVNNTFTCRFWREDFEETSKTFTIPATTAGKRSHILMFTSMLIFLICVLSTTKYAKCKSKIHAVKSTNNHKSMQNESCSVNIHKSFNDSSQDYSSENKILNMENTQLLVGQSAANKTL
ncbi:programmed cell death 1 ligand 1-like isoform 1-T3 [Discoglossus pictus]